MPATGHTMKSDGGPSQVDTFDPKPMLDKYDGKDPAQLFDVEPTQFNNNGTVLASPWKFKRYGESGIPVSELFPHVAQCVDELAVDTHGDYVASLRRFFRMREKRFR